MYEIAVRHCHPTLLYFKNVTNSKEILEKTLKGETKCTILDPSYIFHPLQIIVATQFAVDACVNQHMKTKSIFLEIMFNISPSKKITETLRMLGLKEHLSELICVTLSLDEAASVCGLVKGDQLDVSELEDNCSKVSRIQELYHIKDVELLNSSVLEILINRISAKAIGAM